MIDHLHEAGGDQPQEPGLGGRTKAGLDQPGGLGHDGSEHEQAPQCCRIKAAQAAWRGS